MKKIISCSMLIIISCFLHAKPRIATIDTSIAYRIVHKFSNLSDDSLQRLSKTDGLSMSDAWKISKKTLYSNYGRMSIIRQRPHHAFRLGPYWVFWGTFKGKRKHRHGGIFEIAINAMSGKVEYCSHGK